MSKKLNLDSIPEEILDEIFTNENTTLNLLEVDQIEDQTEEHVQEEEESVSISAPYAKLQKKHKSTFTNEELMTMIVDGQNVKKNREIMVRQNYGLVYLEAKKCTCNIPFSDKIQYAFEGLLKAMDKYNPKQATKFSTYATSSIRKTLYRYGNNDVRLVSLPEYLSVHNIDIQNYIDAFTNQFHVTPTIEQVSVGTGIPVYNVKNVMNYKASQISMDTPVQSVESDVTLQDVMTGDGDDYSLDEGCFSYDFAEGINAAIKHLEPWERKIFSVINGFDGNESHTLDETIVFGLPDAKGKPIVSKPTLQRRYTAILRKVSDILIQEGIHLRDK